MTIFIYPDPTPVMPTLNGFSVHKKPTFASVLAEAVSGRAVMGTNAAFPLWDFELTYEVLRSQTQNRVPDTYYSPNVEFEAIASLFLACAGSYGRFWYDDPTDNSRTAQVIGTSDGVSLTWQIIRTYGIGSVSFTEPVGGLNDSLPYTFYDNGSPVAVTLANNNRTITFAAPITAGHLITGDFSYYFYCRFLEDGADFEQFMHNLWSLRTLRFRSVKP